MTKKHIFRDFSVEVTIECKGKHFVFLLWRVEKHQIIKTHPFYRYRRDGGAITLESMYTTITPARDICTP